MWWHLVGSAIEHAAELHAKETAEARRGHSLSFSGPRTVAGAMAQSDTGKSTDPSSASGNKTAEPKSGGDSMKSTGSGYESKSAVDGAVGQSPGNAASGKSGKTQ
jgi:hypothetical protein